MAGIKTFMKFLTTSATLLALSCNLSGGTERVYPEGTVVEDGVATNGSTGLVYGLTLDENIDSSSPVVIMGAQWTTGFEGSALEFNGYDYYAAVPDLPELSLASEGSILLWLYAYTHSPYCGVLHKGEQTDYSDETWSLQFWQATGQLALFLINSPGVYMDVRSTVFLPTGLWIHTAATWDAGMVKLYINGTLDNAVPNTIGTVMVSSGRLIIGAQTSTPFNVGDGHRGFNGIIDEIQIYDRALSAAEVQNAYLYGWP
jgi:hypothetical protein